MRITNKGKILIMSDIHGNLIALKKVLQKALQEKISGIIILGDLIDYGPSSNEVIEQLSQIPDGLVYCNIWGNHEYAVMKNDFSRFSTDRGKINARYTKNHLTDKSIKYISTMTQSGKEEFEVNGKKCLAIHGSLDDMYWKSIEPTNVHGDYSEYDYVFSGHSHREHYFSIYYKCNNPEMRNEKRTVFINPGSVGQPRNHNSAANYALLDVTDGSMEFGNILYDVERTQSMFTEDVDSFYKERLDKGI